MSKKQSKKCTKCGLIKDISLFNVRKDRPCGIMSGCRQCLSAIGVANSKAFNKTRRGVCSRIYNSQTYHSKKRNHPLPSYSKDDLREWILADISFEKLYLAWVSSGYNTRLKPSVDRLDDSKPYTLCNIQIVTFNENRSKSHMDGKSGLLQKARRYVTKYSLDGVAICSYISINEAARVNGVSAGNISSVCHNSGNTTGGFMWSFA